MKSALIVIEKQDDHAEAKSLVGRLMMSRDPRDASRLAAQARLIEDYERRKWPRRAPSVATVLSYLMDQHGLLRADLVPVLGTASRVSEVLAGKRVLNLTMARRLHGRFAVSADVLILRGGSLRGRMAA